MQKLISLLIMSFCVTNGYCMNSIDEYDTNYLSNNDSLYNSSIKNNKPTRKRSKNGTKYYKYRNYTSKYDKALDNDKYSIGNNELDTNSSTGSDDYDYSSSKHYKNNINTFYEPSDESYVDDADELQNLAFSSNSNELRSMRNSSLNTNNSMPHTSKVLVNTNDESDDDVGFQNPIFKIMKEQERNNINNNYKLYDTTINDDEIYNNFNDSSKAKYNNDEVNDSAVFDDLDGYASDY